MKKEYFVVKQVDEESWYQLDSFEFVQKFNLATLFESRDAAMEVVKSLSCYNSPKKFSTKRVVVSVMTKSEESV
jgi:hypothetical protein